MKDMQANISHSEMKYCDKCRDFHERIYSEDLEWLSGDKCIYDRKMDHEEYKMIMNEIQRKLK